MGKKLIIAGADFSANAVELPHTILDWVASSQSGQFFDLGVFARQKMRLEIEVSATQNIINSTSEDRIGLVGCAVNNNVSLGITYIPKYTCYTANATNSMAYASNCKFGDTLKHVLSIDQTKFLIDGLVKKEFVEGTIDDNNSSYPLYAMGTDLTNCMSTEFHTHSITIFSDRDDNDSVIHKYYPVKKKDGTICLWDFVTDNYIYSNIGTPNYGEF